MTDNMSSSSSSSSSALFLTQKKSKKSRKNNKLPLNGLSVTDALEKAGYIRDDSRLCRYRHLVEPVVDYYQKWCQQRWPRGCICREGLQTIYDRHVSQCPYRFIRPSYTATAIELIRAFFENDDMSKIFDVPVVIVSSEFADWVNKYRHRGADDILQTMLELSVLKQCWYCHEEMRGEEMKRRLHKQPVVLPSPRMIATLLHEHCWQPREAKSLRETARNLGLTDEEFYGEKFLQHKRIQYILPETLRHHYSMVPIRFPTRFYHDAHPTDNNTKKKNGKSPATTTSYGTFTSNNYRSPNLDTGAPGKINRLKNKTRQPTGISNEIPMKKKEEEERKVDALPVVVDQQSVETTVMTEPPNEEEEENSRGEENKLRLEYPSNLKLEHRKPKQKNPSKSNHMFDSSIRNIMQEIFDARPRIERPSNGKNFTPIEKRLTNHYQRRASAQLSAVRNTSTLLYVATRLNPKLVTLIPESTPGYY